MAIPGMGGGMDMGLPQGAQTPPTAAPQATSRLAAMMPQIMNAIGGGDERTQALLMKQDQQNQQQTKMNNIQNFMRAVTSSQTGEITEGSIQHFAQLFNVAPNDAMKVITDFENHRAARRGPDQTFSEELPSGRIHQFSIPGGDPAPPGVMRGTISGSPTPQAKEPSIVKVPDGKGGWKMVEKTAGLSGQNNPTKGMRIVTNPDGTTTVETGVATGGELTRPVKTDVQKKILEANATYSDMKNTLAKYDDKFLKGRNKLGYGIDAFKEKWDLGNVSDADKEDLKEYTSFKRDSVSSLNNYIKQVTGAAMSAAEADRLMKAMPNPGTGLFDGDSPTEFKTKLDGVMRNLERAIARNSYVQKQGLRSINEVGLEQMDGIIDARGDELMAELQAAGVPPEEIEAQVIQSLSDEFGVKF